MNRMEDMPQLNRDLTVQYDKELNQHPLLISLYLA